MDRRSRRIGSLNDTPGITSGSAGRFHEGSCLDERSGTILATAYVGLLKSDHDAERREGLWITVHLTVNTTSSMSTSKSPPIPPTVTRMWVAAG